MWYSNKLLYVQCSSFGDLLLEFFFLQSLLLHWGPLQCWSPSPPPFLLLDGSHQPHWCPSWGLFVKVKWLESFTPPLLPSRHVRPHLTCQPCDYKAAGWDVLFWPRRRWEQQAQRRFTFESCVLTRKNRVCFLSLSSDTSFPASRTLVHFGDTAAGEGGGFDRTSQDIAASLTRWVLFCFFFIMAPLLFFNFLKKATWPPQLTCWSCKRGTSVRASVRASRQINAALVWINHFRFCWIIDPPPQKKHSPPVGSNWMRCCISDCLQPLNVNFRNKQAEECEVRPVERLGCILSRLPRHAATLLSAV